MADIIVSAGGNLQAALTAAVGGDRILLEAGATFTGDFTFPTKGSLVTLTSSAYASLPNRRIAPSDASLLPIVVTSSGVDVFTFGTAANWLVDGVQFLANPSQNGIISIQGGNNITLRRLLYLPDVAEQTHRFCLGNGTNITFDRCYISGVWKSGQDTQGFAAWDGAGPYTITDNYLEVASENILFGGEDSASIGNVPADILVEDNFCTKSPLWEGLARQVKNLFELKAAKRVVVQDNIFERCWADAQDGTAIVFTPRNQSGTAPWTVVEDVIFRRNTVRLAASGLDIAGYDDLATSAQTTGIEISNNLFSTAAGRCFTLLNRIGTLVISHNTFVSASSAFSISLDPSGGAYAVNNLTLTNNMLQGDFTSPTANGGAALTAQCPTFSSLKNAIGGAAYADYGVDNFTLTLAAYTASFDADYLLVPASPYNNAGTDGLDLGWAGMAAPAVPSLTYLWTMVSGPGVATFADATNPLTTVSFSAIGTYVLQLAATDCAATGTDTVTITMHEAPYPPPAVSTTRVMRRLRRAPHVSNEGKRVLFDKFQLDLEVGLGTATGQGLDPTLMLRWSDDGGQSWGSEHWISAGRQGEYKTRAIWRRTGAARDRVFELVVTDPNPWRLNGVWLDVRMGGS